MNDMTVYETIRSCVSAEDGDSAIVKGNVTLLNALDKMISFLEEFRQKGKYRKTRLKESCIIDCLFNRAYNGTVITGRDQRLYLDALSICLIDYIGFLKDRIEKVGVTKYAIESFAIDASKYNMIFDNRFMNVYSARSNTSLSVAMRLSDIRGFVWSGQKPCGVDSDMYGIFAIRQTIEVGLRNMIGLQDIDPMPKLHHGFIFDIIKRYSGDIRIDNESSSYWEPLKHIYNWTNCSIHKMITQPGWLIWKALSFTGRLFRPGVGGGYWSICGSIKISASVLIEIQAEVKRGVQQLINQGDKKQQLTIWWKTPDCIVIGEDGNAQKFRPRRDTIVFGADEE